MPSSASSAPVSEPTALVARSAVAVAHVGRLIRSPHGRRDDDRAVSVVDDGGEPWVLTPPWERPAPGPARLRIVTADGASAGGPPAAVVLLAGRLEARAVATVENLPGALRAALERHRSCFDLGSRPVLAVSRFAVASIGVAVPRGSGVLRALEPVPLADYAASEPDLWTIQAPGVLAHLSERHADALLELARRAGATDAVLAAAHAVEPDALTVAAIGPDGGRLVRLPFPERLTSPSDVGRALFG